MKKQLFLCLAGLCLLTSASGQPGIRFFGGTWSEAVALAKEQDRKIFVDFYTEWCGPCLNMATKVFVLPEVGDIYNRNFICMKIDAEKGEGVELARRYGVKSYPAYVFIDPATEEVVHRSGSNKSPERFIYDAEGALDPLRNSVFLEKAYADGGYDSDFLKRYIMYKDATLSRDLVNLFDELIAMGHSLSEPEIWEIYDKVITGFRNPYLKEISDNYAKYVELYGREAVDRKLAGSTGHAPVEVLEQMPEFKGKVHNIAVSRLSDLLQKNEYAKGYDMLRTLQGNPEIDQTKLVTQISFYTRIMPKGREDELPFDVLVDKMKLARYVAYNNYDRDDAMPHYYYALGLEYLVARAQSEGRPIPAELFADPEFGKPGYDMRHPELKLKPARKQ